MPLPAKFGGSADVVFYSPPEPLWTPRPLTRCGEFTTGIEGPACDAKGNVFAVNFRRAGNDRPNSTRWRWRSLRQTSRRKHRQRNSLRRDGSFYVADYTGHNVLKVDPKTRDVSVFAHHDGMNQPNDLAIAPDGTLYASDPNWSEGTGTTVAN